ncbi:MAG TPA: NAD(P)-dependent oxidoreductase [Gemmatimonadaceae bacterium]|nr:NAD(P)-dependent oxidoreductase [Gemmatimonadaceae bacterium]
MTLPSTPPRVGLLGLGLMGSGMARRLLGAGFPLTVYNRTAEKAATLVAEGARLARSPRDAADGAEFVVSMVADDTASRGLWLGDDGALDGMRSGTLVIESSTVTPTWIRALAAAANAKGIDVLDAPVTGSRTQAASGELSFLVGGSVASLGRAQPVFGAMGKSALHVGPTGSGALLKLINNFLCGVQAASLAEALVLIEKAGLDRETATQVLANGAPGSPLVKTLLQRMMAQDYAPHFHLSLMRKDLEYSLKEGQRHGVALSAAQSALASFERAVAAGHGQRDVSAVVEPVREAVS